MIDTRERPRQLNSGGKIMKTIQIEKIKTKENIRKDYGDLTELTASIVFCAHPNLKSPATLA